MHICTYNWMDTHTYIYIYIYMYVVTDIHIYIHTSHPTHNGECPEHLVSAGRKSAMGYKKQYIYIYIYYIHIRIFQGHAYICTYISCMRKGLNVRRESVTGRTTCSGLRFGQAACRRNKEQGIRFVLATNLRYCNTTSQHEAPVALREVFAFCLLPGRAASRRDPGCHKWHKYLLPTLPCEQQLGVDGALT